MSDKLDPNEHLDHLLDSTTETPWYRSLVDNLKYTFGGGDKSLPPLQVTSKPVSESEVHSMLLAGGISQNQSKASVISLGVHFGLIGLLLFLATLKPVRTAATEALTKMDLIAPPPLIDAPIKKQTMAGGGGGGTKAPTPPAKGMLPKKALKQFVPPQQVLLNEQPKLPVEPTIVLQPETPLPNIQMANLGNPLDKLGKLSNGSGSGGGIGSGSGGGIGSGKGGGVGPGQGGGYGGGVFRIGGGVSAPVPLFKPDPEYSEEARKAKFQGTVTLAVVVDENGKAEDIRVIRQLGLGLDEKAIEAVKKWRFKPAMKDGRPVPVRANIEVNFRLL